MKRVLGHDVPRYHASGNRRLVIALMPQPSSIRRILDHAGLGGANVRLAVSEVESGKELWLGMPQAPDERNLGMSFAMRWWPLT